MPKTKRYPKVKFTKAQYDAALESQKGLCGSCGGPPEEPTRLIPDWDYEGNFCSLLCANCKDIVDWAGRDPKMIDRMLTYIGDTRRVTGPKE